jgi:hypothetical protein
MHEIFTAETKVIPSQQQALDKVYAELMTLKKKVDEKSATNEDFKRVGELNDERVELEEALKVIRLEEAQKLDKAA